MIYSEANTRSRLLAAHDVQLRTDAETPNAINVTPLGALRRVTFMGGRGFITYQDLGGVTAEAVRRLVPEALSHFASDPGIEQVEWKTRGHDFAPGLHNALLENGFIPDESESIMVGEALALAVDVPLPDGVTLRQVTKQSDVRAMSAMQDEVFGDPVSEDMAKALLRRLSFADGMELWVAEVKGKIVTAGRLEPVRDSDFAGIWGGATRAEWRGQGIYRALTAARARSAIAMGKTLIHSDSTDYSRPILERAGLIAVSKTTPYNWKRRAHVSHAITCPTRARPASFLAARCLSSLLHPRFPPPVEASVSGRGRGTVRCGPRRDHGDRSRPCGWDRSGMHPAQRGTGNDTTAPHDASLYFHHRQRGSRFRHRA